MVAHIGWALGIGVMMVAGVWFGGTLLATQPVAGYALAVGSLFVGLLDAIAARARAYRELREARAERDYVAAVSETVQRHALESLDRSAIRVARVRSAVRAHLAALEAGDGAELERTRRVLEELLADRRPGERRELEEVG